MARMSIDDKFLRDARVVLLGRRFGWSRRETMGALLDVFALTYDQETDIISHDEVDVAAGEAGFAKAMIDVDLGEPDDSGVRIKGAAERIEYLAAKREAGRKGGRKSGESRRNKHEAKRSTASSTPQASGNPPDPVPDPAPVPEDQKLSPARDPAVPTPAPPDCRSQDASPGEDTVAGHVAETPDVGSAHRDTNARPSREDRRAVRDEIRGAINAARARVGAKLGTPLHPCLPFDRGIDNDLSGQLDLAPNLEALEAIARQARHAVAMAEIEATADPMRVQFLTGAIFAGGNFARLCGQTAAGAARIKSRASPPSSAERAPDEPRKIKTLT